MPNRRIITLLRRPLAAAVLGLCLSLPALADQPLDGIAAVVNEDVILASELEQETQLIKDQLSQRGTPVPPDAVLTRQVLERLIMQRLQLSIAERAGIRVDDNTLNSAVLRVAQQNKMSLTEFRDTLEREGFDYAAFRNNLRNEITISRLRQRQVDSQVQVSPQEIDEFLSSQATADSGREYLLGHILIALPDGADAEQVAKARQQAEALRAQLANGADFAQAAAAHSASQTALEGGSLGWRRMGQLPTLFAGAVGELEVGEVGPLLQTPGGFHLIKLLDRRDADRQVVTQTRARHILIQPNEVVSDRDARLRLETLRQRIQEGEDFGQLARANSADKGSASQGGELGWMSPGVLVPPFEQAMNALEPGQLSEPVRTQFGWHLIQVLERREHDSTDELRRARAAESIRERKAEEVIESWLRRLRDEAYVDIRLDA